jgi:hypothetical protein
LFVDASGNVEIKAQGDLRFADSDSSNWVAFQAPATVASNVTWTLPAADGTSAQVLSTNGSGTLSWSSVASDKISEGNTEAEVVDTGSDGHFKVTTEGTERLRVDPSGRLLIGISTARSIAFATPSLQVEGVNYERSHIQVWGSGNNVNGGYLSLGKSRGTGWTIVQNNDTIGRIQFLAADGTDEVDAAYITAKVDGTPGNNDMPCRLEFHTTADGDNVPTERLRISNNGTFTGSASNDISDQRLKQNIQTIADPLDKVKALIGRTFEWKPEAKMQDGVKYGFIAQEVEAVVPELVECGTGIRMLDFECNVVEKPSEADGPCEYAKSVQSSGVLPILVEAFKEALAKIETLEAKVAALEAQ